MENLSVEKDYGWKRSDSDNPISYKIKEFDAAIYLVNSLGEAHEVSPKGDLALLALGHVGLEAWRKARELSK
jgi:hypothetical protein